MALIKVAITTGFPAPIKAFIGPGEAPVDARPTSKINPP